MANQSSNLTEKQEQALANLLVELADDYNQGKSLSLDEVCKSHPEFATDLRELWGTMVVTQAATSMAVNEIRTGPYTPNSDQMGGTLELPCEFGDYYIEEEIGRGGMGIVYRAIRTSDQQPVALKMILKGDFATQTDRERFQAEAEASLRLDHPNIVPISEIGELQGRAFFCMKLIEGQTLSDRLNRGPVPNRRAAQWGASIAQAIDYAHSQGVLHRDLKPSNILIDNDGIPYVADFGLAKRDYDHASLTKSGAVLGTPSYMSPEQAAGARGQVGKVSDVYSMGAILYHMLTGRPPFLAATPVETVLQVLEQDPLPPRALNQRADRKLEMIAMRCLQKPQDLRYSSAKGLVKDLNAFLDNKSISAQEGRIGQIVANLFRETHHAEVLENWGVIWMWHSLVLLVASFATNILSLYGTASLWPYWLMWTVGLGTWAVVFWMVRRQMGPVTFVERQIAHVWAASMCCVAFLFPLESALGIEPLSLAPLLGVVAGMVFLIKAGILSGSFYVQSVTMFLTAILMVMLPRYAMFLFGLSAGTCFFYAGLKYYRRRTTRSDTQRG